MIRIMRRMVVVLGMVAVCMVSMLGMGCESDGGGGGGGGGGNFAGTWALYEGSSIGTSPYWYAHFNEDKTYFISDNADGSGVRVRGTYEVSDKKLTGPFTNPGVGEGRVEATINDGIMALDFIEYWHTPNKVVPYAGVKI